jgi:hypothetical protein
MATSPDNRISVTLWPLTKDAVDRYAKHLGATPASVCAHIINNWLEEHTKTTKNRPGG